MKYGSYTVIIHDDHTALGFNEKNLQPYVTWWFDGFSVDSAVYFDNFIEAYTEYIRRSRQYDKELNSRYLGNFRIN